MIRPALLILLALAACSRPLSENEDAFAKALFGETLDREAIRVRAGAGLTPLPGRDDPEDETPRPPPETAPEGFCTRVERTQRPRRWPVAFVLWNDIFFSYDFYAHDTLAGWPASVPVPQALIMTHELVHVWQWQNRGRTAYRPSASAGESAAKVDPYYWEPDASRDFFSYGFEQQAAMIEDYVCYRLFDKRAPELGQIESILEPVLPLEGFEAAFGP